LHELSTSFVLGYHGCDETVAKGLLHGAPFRQSDNDYDWLGKGVYFWENNPLRGMEFARELQTRGRNIQSPFVVGAIIDLGRCLDLMSSNGLRALKASYKNFMEY